MRTTASVHLVRSSRSAVQLSAQDEKSSGVHALPEIRSLRTRSKYGADLRTLQEHTKITATHKNVQSFRSFVPFVRYVNELPALAILRALASLTRIFGAFAVFHHYKNK